MHNKLIIKINKVLITFLSLLMIIGITSCQSVVEPYFKNNYTPTGSYSIAWNKLPVIDKNRNLHLGGFVGLYYYGGRIFYTITDRGPVLQQLDESGASTYFLSPSFTPQIIKLELEDDHSIKIVEQIPIKNPLGNNTTGLLPPDTWNQFEDILNTGQSSDPWGLFPGGIVMDVEKHLFWFADQYKPALMQITVDGRWVRRLRPGEGLRKAFKNIAVDGGFTGVDINSDGDLVTLLGRSLEHNRNINDKVQNRPINYALRRVVIYKFSTTSDISMFYFVEPQAYDGIPEKFISLGDIAAVNDSSYLITEYGNYNGMERSLLFKAVITDSTSRVEPGLEGIDNKTFETLDSTEWAKNKLIPLKKELLVNLGTIGISRPEGLAIIDANHVAIINNNDYDITNGNPISKSYILNGKPTVIKIITLPANLSIKKRIGQ